MTDTRVIKAINHGHLSGHVIDMFCELVIYQLMGKYVLKIVNYFWVTHFLRFFEDSVSKKSECEAKNVMENVKKRMGERKVRERRENKRKKGSEIALEERREDRETRRERKGKNEKKAKGDIKTGRGEGSHVMKERERE